MIAVRSLRWNSSERRPSIVGRQKPSVLLFATGVLAMGGLVIENLRLEYGSNTMSTLLHPGVVVVEQSPDEFHSHLATWMAVQMATRCRPVCLLPHTTTSAHGV